MAGSSLPEAVPEPNSPKAAEPESSMSIQLDVPPALAGLVAKPPTEEAPPALSIEPPPPPPPPPPAPVKNPDATVKLPNPTPMVLESLSEKPADASEAKPARKGPVWPI